MAKYTIEKHYDDMWELCCVDPQYGYICVASFETEKEARETKIEWEGRHIVKAEYELPIPNELVSKHPDMLKDVKAYLQKKLYDVRTQLKNDCKNSNNSLESLTEVSPTYKVSMDKTDLVDYSNY